MINIPVALFRSNFVFLINATRSLFRFLQQKYSHINDLFAIPS